MHQERLGIKHVSRPSDDFGLARGQIMQAVRGVLENRRTTGTQIHFVDIADRLEKLGMMRLRLGIDKG